MTFYSRNHFFFSSPSKENWYQLACFWVFILATTNSRNEERLDYLIIPCLPTDLNLVKWVRLSTLRGSRSSMSMMQRRWQESDFLINCPDKPWPRAHHERALQDCFAPYILERVQRRLLQLTQTVVHKIWDIFRVNQSQEYPGHLFLGARAFSLSLRSAFGNKLPVSFKQQTESGNYDSKQALRFVYEFCLLCLRLMVNMRMFSLQASPSYPRSLIGNGLSMTIHPTSALLRWSRS